MNLTIRKEEYAPLADFIKESFVKDQDAIMIRYPKMDASFLADFEAKIEVIKRLESSLVITEEQKNATASMYEEANELNNELNFLNSYIKEAKLTANGIVSDLKKDLKSSNIEGAILKIETVRQYVVAHEAVLIAEGMNPNFATTLANHNTSLIEKNKSQNKLINARKELTEANKKEYSDLYKSIVKIARAGKLVLNGSIRKDEYTITKITSRMRAAKKNNAATPPPTN